MRDRLWLPAGLCLRPWALSDAPAVLEAFAEPVMRRQADAPVATAAETEQWIRRRRDQWQHGVAYGFAVADGGDTALGCVAVGGVNAQHSTGWVSYWTTAAARGRGVAAHGCRALADWCFTDLGLFRLELGHRTDNPASCRVARAAGFAPEGLQRRKLAYDGVRYDVELHARLATDPHPEQQEHEVRISRHFERARKWGAVEDAERLHDAEKRDR
ncbi:GNAT family N-acetyltransferase [Streptomyces verrucosisporus]|uniref:GNAT family N-acetyltransferase n=1 Tax=Streptomyces verrucosisporus TaxID=1695161 RepID=UPI0019D055D8|nr:GNAT family N-acetyltransferase [Streptomyces verrucosisporus]MBN3930161.1 GNAT family N-acetyltransferase [Streptomyces verrucosisporus]